MPTQSEIYYWGDNKEPESQIFLSKQCSPRYLTVPLRVVSISSTSNTTYFLSDQGDLYSACFAAPLFPHLSSQKITQISSGLNHSVLITANGLVYAWGKGEFGALGLGDTRDVVLPEKVNCPKGVQISCGLRHSACLTISGLFYWGCEYVSAETKGNNRKQLRVRPSPFKIQLENIKAVSAGDQFTLCLAENGQILGFGNNSCGQLGTGNKKNALGPVPVESEVKFKAIACGSHSAGVSVDGDLFVWGTGIFGEWLVPKKVNVSNVVQICLSSGFGFAIDKEGSVHSWGNNTHGELGLGNYEQRTGVSSVNLLKNRGISQIFSANSSVYALGRVLEPKKKYRRSMNKENIDPGKAKEIESLKNLIQSKDQKIRLLESRVDEEEILKLQKENEYFKNAFEEMKKFKQQCFYSMSQESEKRQLAENFVKELHSEHRQLVDTIEDLEKNMAKLSKQCEIYQGKAEKHDILLEKFQKVVEENEKLKVIENVSKRYKSDYSCESISLASPDVSVVYDRKYRKDSPDNRLRTSKSSNDLFQFFEPIRSTSPSPIEPFKNNDPQTPPTFRDQGISNSGTIKNSLNEIRARLNLLQENKAELEGKMTEFEKRLREQI